MTIDPFSTPLLSLAQVARQLGMLNRGRPVSPSSVYRWIHDGLIGPDGQAVKLRAIRVGRTFATSQDCVREFLDKLNGNADAVAPRSPSERSRASAAAAKKLDRLGIGC